MFNNISPNARIVKNTRFLTLKQIIVLVITLVSTHVILGYLGVTDYGIYSAMMGSVTMFSFLQTAMGRSTSRYIAYAVGKGEERDMKRTFSSSVFAHFAFAILIVVICEGLWFFYTKTSLSFVGERMSAASWVFQFWILSFAIGEFRKPFEAEVIAHENMEVMAFISVFEALLKLSLVLLLKVIPFDSLILYGLTILLVQMVNLVLFAAYCLRKYPETHNVMDMDVLLILKMYCVAFLILVGSSMAIAWGYVANIWVVSFCGVAVLTARSVAMQMQEMAKGFVADFQLAVSPQITKTYATENMGRMHNLVISSSKFSLFLFLVFCIPLLLKAESILSLWTTSVTVYSVSFLRLFLIVMLVGLWQAVLNTANIATGKLVHILVFQLVSGLLPMLLLLPLSYWVLKEGLSPALVFIIQIIVMLVSLIVQLFIIRWSIGLSLRKYCWEVFARGLAVSVLAAVLPVLVSVFLPLTVTSLIIVAVLSVVSVAVASYFVGLNKQEKHILRHLF